MKITKIEDKIVTRVESGEPVPGLICIICTTCFPCKPPECTQSRLTQPVAPEACGPWGAGFASLGQ